MTGAVNQKNGASRKACLTARQASPQNMTSRTAAIEQQHRKYLFIK